MVSSKATTESAKNPYNAPPFATDDAAATAFGTTLFGMDVLANDTDDDGDPLRVTFANSKEGDVILNDDGTLDFIPAVGFSGLARIFYRITDRPDGDPNALTDWGTVEVTVGKPGIDVPPTPTRDGIISGTEGADIIDIDYTGDPDGDRVDNEDAILPLQEADDDIIRAGGGDDVISAGKGDDDVDGGTGDDSITTGAGSDSVLGGDGDDVINTSGPDLAPDQGYPFSDDDPLGFDPDTDPENDRDFVDAGAGDDLVRTGDDRDTVLGGTGADSINAGLDDDRVDGGADDDRIVGGEGRDTLLGGEGNDTIFAGNDSFEVPDGLNIPDAASGTPFSPDRNPENGRDFVDGGAGNDLIFGADDDDTLLGGTGDDLIDGETDDDLLMGGAGDDILRGGEGSDSLFGDADRDLFDAVTAGDNIDGGSGGDDFDTLDLRGSLGDAARLRVEYTSDDREDGIVTYYDEDWAEAGTVTFTEIESVVSCFTPGTRIATPQGERKIEDLKVGDLVITRDNGMQEIRWKGARHLTGMQLDHQPHLRPVLVQQGALGMGLPLRDMLVSPNHRLLMANDKTALYFEDREVLVAAKHLTDLPGIDCVEVSETTYLHILFDRHEVILSDGAWTESFQPGVMALAGVDDAQRQEILTLFPQLADHSAPYVFTSARKSLKKHEAKLLVD